MAGTLVMAGLRLIMAVIAAWVPKMELCSRLPVPAELLCNQSEHRNMFCKIRLHRRCKC